MLEIRSKRAVLTIVLWAVGVGTISCLTPGCPHVGWQPAEDEVFCGFLQDSKTLVTATRLEPDRYDALRGPIRLWNIETGDLRASHFGTEDLFSRVSVNQVLDALCIEECARGDRPHNLRIHDATTGLEICRLKCEYSAVEWKISPDGKMIAVPTWDETECPLKAKKIAVHEIAPDLRLALLPQCQHPIFSPDSRRIAASTLEGEVIVFDIPSKNEIARFNSDLREDPREFSPDGKLLLGSRRSVWDVEARTCRFSLPDSASFESPLFTPDGRILVVVESAPNLRLAYIDTDTGQEIPKRYASLSVGQKLTRNFTQLMPARSDFSLLIASGLYGGSPNTLPHWVRKLPFISWFNGFPGHKELRNEFELVDLSTGRELIRQEGFAIACAPNGRYFVCEDVPGGRAELWDIPPQKPLRLMLAFLAMWTLLLWVLPRFARVVYDRVENRGLRQGERIESSPENSKGTNIQRGIFKECHAQMR